MLDDEATVRTLIERWASAAQAGDIEGVVADHSADIVMFDVPPPEDGARGIDAYRKTGRPFSGRRRSLPTSITPSRWSPEW